MIYSLKDYQRDAVDELKEYFVLFLNSNKKDKTLTFKSPTGSGKTFMISALFEELCEEYNNYNFCFIWASIGKGELQRQSYENVKRYLGGNPVCSLLENDFFGARSFIKKHEIVFVNWEKLVQKDKATGEWINTLMMDQEGRSFLDVVDKTKINGTKIILIVDESHIGANSASRIAEFKKQIIIPDITIEMSATPLSEHIDVEVSIEQVIAEGMIKEDVIVNEGIKRDDISIVDKDSELLVLEKAFKKRLQLKDEYEKNNSIVNPLVLIQIPNVDAGEAKKEVVKDFLRSQGITEENGKLKLWCDDKGHFNKKKIKEIDDETEFLIFKTAVATGWDCPRAQILIKFREGKSETFEIQTIGRILRTAEAKHYKNYLLDNAYIFTNIKEFETKRDTYNPNKIKTEFSYLPQGETKQSVFEQTHLTSYYRSREGDYNSADSRFTKYFEVEFMKFFDLNENDKYNYWTANETKFVAKGMNMNLDTNDTLMEETKLGYIDDAKNVSSDLANVKMSDTDIQAAFYNLVRSNLGGLAYVRSKSSVNVAFLDAFNKFYSKFNRSNIVKNVQRLVVQNYDIFALILNNASIKFKELLQQTAYKKGHYYDFYIEDKRGYSIETHKELIAPKSLYQPLYVLMRDSSTGVINRLEEQFISYLNGTNEVDWMWENGPELMQINFGIPYNNGMSTFQPDFIVKFVNGWVGIFDTKPINFNVEDTTIKAQALNSYLVSINSNRGKYPKVVGGIVVKKGDVFYYHNGYNYKDIESDLTGWKSFNELLREIKLDYDVQQRKLNGDDH